MPRRVGGEQHHRAEQAAAGAQRHDHVGLRADGAQQVEVLGVARALASISSVTSATSSAWPVSVTRAIVPMRWSP